MASLEQTPEIQIKQFYITNFSADTEPPSPFLERKMSSVTLRNNEPVECLHAGCLDEEKQRLKGRNAYVPEGNDNTNRRYTKRKLFTRNNERTITL